jgi:hypothetical protein
MGIVELPIVAPTIQLREAFDVMRDRRRSAVVTRESNALWLIEAVDIARGLSAGRASLDQLDPRDRQRLVTPSAQRLASRNVSLVFPQESWSQLESMLDEDRADFAVLAAGREIATVITRHEGIEARLEPAPATCYCTSTPRCSGGGNATGDTCTLGHRGAVFCV